jgi:hypothetical protein
MVEAQHAWAGAERPLLKSSTVTFLNEQRGVPAGGDNVARVWTVEPREGSPIRPTQHDGMEIKTDRRNVIVIAMQSCSIPYFNLRHIH